MSKTGLAIIAAGLIALTSGAYYAGYKHENLVWSAKWATRDKSDAQQAEKNVKAAAETSAQRNEDRDNTQKAADEKVTKAQANADDADNRVKRLLATVAKLRAMQRAGDPTTTAGESAADRASDLQSVMLSESIGRNQQLANYADNLKISVESCNDQYNSLTKKKAP